MRVFAANHAVANRDLADLAIVWWKFQGPIESLASKSLQSTFTLSSHMLPTVTSVIRPQHGKKSSRPLSPGFTRLMERGTLPGSCSETGKLAPLNRMT